MCVYIIRDISKGHKKGNNTPVQAGSQGRIKTRNWDLYDTRYAVFSPASMSACALEDGYWKAYRDFYSWPSIFSSARGKSLAQAARHIAYTAGWKKMEPLWDQVIRSRRISSMIPLLETLLDMKKNKKTVKLKVLPAP